MAATFNKAEYAASAAITATGLASLGSSSTLVAGYSLVEIDNSTTNKYFDEWLTGAVKVGTTPTVNTVIEVWIVPKREDGSYHDAQAGSGFDGTAKAVTATARSMLRAYGKLLATMDVDTTTTGRVYEFSGSIARACEGMMPAKYQVFVTHNTGVALDATGSNFGLWRKPFYSSSGN